MVSPQPKHHNRTIEDWRHGMSTAKTAKVKKLHRDAYAVLCGLELARRDGLTEWPEWSPDDPCPFWVECIGMVEEIYGERDGTSEGNYIWPPCEKSNRIAADPTLAHAEKVKVLDAIFNAWKTEEDIREAKREAAKTPEQRTREKRCREANVGEYVYPLDVIERPFFEHLTDAGRISVRGLGIRLD